jgi:hypothetical protein
MAKKQLLSLTLPKELSVDKESLITERELIEALTERVEWMLDNQLDLLLSLLYRLDVLEVDIQAVLSKKDVSPAKDLAMLIIERQKKKLETREKYRTKGFNWED